MKTCVIIPAYNEAQNIAQIVSAVKALSIETIVIDDGSIDNTMRKALDQGAIVLRNTVNQGKGASLIKGFEHAVAQGYVAVITMDADGQHLPEDIAEFIKLSQDNQNSFLIGNRMQNTQAMPFIRVLTNKFMSFLISSLAKQNIPDTQCGFRLIKKEVLSKIKLTTAKYETESEILLEASRLGFKIKSLPIQSIYRGEKSQINPFIDTMRFVRFLSRNLWTTKRFAKK